MVRAASLFQTLSRMRISSSSSMASGPALRTISQRARLQSGRQIAFVGGDLGIKSGSSVRPKRASSTKSKH